MGFLEDKLPENTEKVSNLRSKSNLILEHMLSPVTGLLGIDLNTKMNAKDQEVSNVLNKIGALSGQIGLSILTGGASTAGTGLLKSLIKKENGGLINKKRSANFNNIIEYKGKTHKEGGIKVGQYELENGEISFPLQDGVEFVFSNNPKINPSQSKTYAQRARSIIKKYSKRPDDSLSLNSLNQELLTLANEQESMKKSANKRNKLDPGGFKYNNPEFMRMRDPLTFQLLDPNFGRLNFNKQNLNNNDLLSRYTGQQPNLNLNNSNQKASEATESNLYKSPIGPLAVGYTAQALSNIPALLLKREDVKFDRVSFDPVNLQNERDAFIKEADKSKLFNRSIVNNLKLGPESLNFLAAQNAKINEELSSNISKSFDKENQLNFEAKLRTKELNANLDKEEKIYNADSKSALKTAKLQALSNIGTAAGLFSKGLLEQDKNDTQFNMLISSSDNYTYNISPHNRTIDKLFKSPKIKMTRKP